VHGCGMDMLIESTKNFENDLSMLSDVERELVITKINDCVDLYHTHKPSVYKKLHCLNPPVPVLVNDYESSLYTLKVSPKLSVILSVDEDPIFEQVVFTLFRVVQQKDLDKAYKATAQSLYQEFLNQDREIVRAS
jgi:hypothetical protein